MDTLTLAYTTGGTTYERDMSVLSHHSIDAPDEWQRIAVLHEHLNGSLSEDANGARLVLALDFGVVRSEIDKQFLFDFLLAMTREVRRSGKVFLPMMENPRTFTNEWLRIFKRSPRYKLRLVNSVVTKTFGLRPQEGEVPYIKLNVVVTGTLDSPELFTTNVGKLLTDQTGQSYPTFSDAKHVHGI